MEEVKKIKNNGEIVYAVGRRKEALARVRLSKGNGQIMVNGKPIGEYFSSFISQKIYSKPLEITKTLNKYHISIKVEGGGRNAQLEAVVHGISRALSKTDGSLRPILKKEKFLTRDARVKERRKYGNAGKARAKKQSPKR
ncbi:30S ribosomal protein S9 [Candidatus Daviesbacteria bacterium]|nr:30S ribosomal protein S9 [Candidatus Daviesbacteria bacterium]